MFETICSEVDVSNQGAVRTARRMLKLSASAFKIVNANRLPKFCDMRDVFSETSNCALATSMYALCNNLFHIYNVGFLPFATWSGKFVKHVEFLWREVNSNHAAWHEAKIQKPESSTMSEEAGSRQNIYFAADLQVHKEK